MTIYKIHGTFQAANIEEAHKLLDEIEGKYPQISIAGLN